MRWLSVRYSLLFESSFARNRRLGAVEGHSVSLPDSVNSPFQVTSSISFDNISFDKLIADAIRATIRVPLASGNLILLHHTHRSRKGFDSSE